MQAKKNFITQKKNFCDKKIEKNVKNFGQKIRKF